MSIRVCWDLLGSRLGSRSTHLFLRVVWHTFTTPITSFTEQRNLCIRAATRRAEGEEEEEESCLSPVRGCWWQWLPWWRPYLPHRGRTGGDPCASSPSSSSGPDAEPSWRPRGSWLQTLTCEQSEGCTGRGLRRRRGRWVYLSPVGFQYKPFHYLYFTFIINSFSYKLNLISVPVFVVLIPTRTGSGLWRRWAQRYRRSFRTRTVPNKLTDVSISALTVYLPSKKIPASFK